MLPQAIQGIELFANYTKFYKGEAPNRQGLIVKPTIGNNFYDWNANYGVSYATPARTFYVQARTVIYPGGVRTAASTTNLNPLYEARHQRWDFTMRYRFSRNYALELTGSNVFEDPSLRTFQYGRAASRRDFGSSYVLSSPPTSTRSSCPSSTAERPGSAATSGRGVSLRCGSELARDEPHPAPPHFRSRANLRLSRRPPPRHPARDADQSCPPAPPLLA